MLLFLPVSFVSCLIRTRCFIEYLSKPLKSDCTQHRSQNGLELLFSRLFFFVFFTLKTMLLGLLKKNKKKHLSF